MNAQAIYHRHQASIAVREGYECRVKLTHRVLGATGLPRKGGARVAKCLQQLVQETVRSFKYFPMAHLYEGPDAAVKAIIATDPPTNHDHCDRSRRAPRKLTLPNRR